MRLTKRVAFITGGNSGIGLATARLFITEGAKVGIVGRNRQSLEEAASLFGDSGVACQADLADSFAMTGPSEQLWSDSASSTFCLPMQEVVIPRR